ncbi:DUF7533 family protein [Haloarcula litorea]|uniref:DUF7533 family protein n=1 Tax=Haloarcula litorea TaxID=3032579 RepID=UPI0023E7E2FD|nr:hypothetical protein [Halomicroarcula sp. GDY20]
MAQGILDTVGLAAVLLLAGPIALFGLEHLVRGDLFGAALYLGVAAGLVVVEQYLTTPTDVPGLVAEKTVGAVVKTDDED